ENRPLVPGGHRRPALTVPLSPPTSPQRERLRWVALHWSPDGCIAGEALRRGPIVRATRRCPFLRRADARVLVLAADVADLDVLAQLEHRQTDRHGVDEQERRPRGPTPRAVPIATVVLALFLVVVTVTEAHARVTRVRRQGHAVTLLLETEEL